MNRVIFINGGFFFIPSIHFQFLIHILSTIELDMLRRVNRVGAGPESVRKVLQVNRFSSFPAVRLQVDSYPGSRVLHMVPAVATDSSSSGRLLHSTLTRSTFKALTDSLKVYDTNDTVAALIINSSNCSLLSVDGITNSNDRQQLLEEANTFSRQLAAAPQVTVALMDGEVDGSLYGILAGCQVVYALSVASNASMVTHSPPHSHSASIVLYCYDCSSCWAPSTHLFGLVSCGREFFRMAARWLTVLRAADLMVVL